MKMTTNKLKNLHKVFQENIIRQEYRKHQQDLTRYINAIRRIKNPLKFKVCVFNVVKNNFLRSRRKIQKLSGFSSRMSYDDWIKRITKFEEQAKNRLIELRNEEKQNQKTIVSVDKKTNNVLFETEKEKQKRLLKNLKYEDDPQAIKDFGSKIYYRNGKF